MTRRTIVTLMLAFAMLMPALGYAQGNGGKKKKQKTEQTQSNANKKKQEQLRRQREERARRQREAEAQRQREAEAQRQREAEAQRQREAEAQRQREAEAQRQREAEAQRQREAEAQRQREANLDPAIRNLVDNMVYVEGGSFMMGSEDSDAFDHEKPVHREYVSSFRIGKYEVTQREWKAVMGNNPSKFKGDNLPVEQVSWDDCQEFIRKLNAKSGKNFRLPTEAEWEYAARGGNLSRGYKYSGSNSIGSVAWYAKNSGNKTHPVGTKSANELGLYDMSGNVWEWTSDNWCGDYNKSRTSPNLVFRGGSWFSTAGCCRVSGRVSDERTFRFNSLGLRLAL